MDKSGITVDDDDCKGNGCDDPFTDPGETTPLVVQRSFTQVDDRSGPIRKLQLGDLRAGSQIPLAGANSFPRCRTGETTVCTPDLGVTLGVEAGLKNDASSTDPPIVCVDRGRRGGSTGSIDCDPRPARRTTPRTSSRWAAKAVRGLCRHARAVERRVLEPLAERLRHRCGAVAVRPAGRGRHPERDRPRDEPTRPVRRPGVHPAGDAGRVPARHSRVPELDVSRRVAQLLARPREGDRQLPARSRSPTRASWCCS